MAKKKGVEAPLSNVTPERAARLFRLVTLLGKDAQSRVNLTRALRLNVRGFYRDLEVLRAAGISVSLAQGKYTLHDDLARAAGRLPFPDPCLTLGEARQLARGRARVHQKLREQIGRIEKK